MLNMPQPKRFTDEQLRANKNARSRQRYQENREQIAKSAAERYRVRYASDPEFRQAQIDRAAKARAANPEYTKLQNAKRRAANPEKSRAESRAWFAKNPNKRAVYEQNRRAKKRASGGKLSHGITEKLTNLQRGKCACCRSTLKDLVQHLDHIVPLALGGAHEDKNMQLLCQTCNQQKHAKHPVDFMREKGFLL